MFSILETNKSLLLPKPETKRNPCACGVMTKLLCTTCYEVNVCKTHKKCEKCKLQQLADKAALLECSKVEQQKEEGRKKARDTYRLKMGIPTDLPLLPRGGARNCKNFTEEELRIKEMASKKYQQLYQRQYRENKSRQALKQKTLELMEKKAEQIKLLIEAGQNADLQISEYQGFEQYFMTL